jgi:outer membrane receptor for ferrienterochelin and colicins
MNKHGVFVIEILGLCGLALSPLKAEEPIDLMKLTTVSIDEIMPIKLPTVYGASKHEQKISDAPSSVTIVTREEIQAYGHRTFADVLRGVRDFYISEPTRIAELKAALDEATRFGKKSNIAAGP